jgi:hypothetical protein
MNWTEGLSNMFNDIFELIKIAVSSKFGLAIITLCAFIYFISVWLAGGFQTYGLILTIISFIFFIIISWMLWFSDKSPNSPIQPTT